MVPTVLRTGTTCTTNPLKEERQHYRLRTMLIVGQVSSKEEANEITFIAKLFIVGQRARFLASNKKAEIEEDEEDEEEEEEEEKEDS
ncbi:MAG: hypothetical protein IMZ53_02465 [Thermoplasmata archaeon]|nr:hypothetical protein [Thermoplasmata archaeon]MBE3139424.1 hypothetical protein [Thermoplasmata archaeon]